MYESHFGFSGTPFNLNPDPAFFFESKGHGNALSYLRFGVYQGEGFVVITGEIGAGKTTLVRTLLSGLDDQKIVSAQIVSTQLEAGDLLRSVAIAFGLAPNNLSKAELIGTIEAFLTLLVTQQKRALLIIDEAQNLGLQAIEELRMLSNFQFGNHALLQSFLVGQPELRKLLTSKPMEQFRQRVIASCHLGPMDPVETNEYIKHRLRKVGWKESPAFDSAAFERIHHWTSGIPRRVNLLCNRLLLATYLDSAATIDAAKVEVVASEVLAEVGEFRAHLAAVAYSSDGGLTLPLKRSERATTWREARSGMSDGSILCVAATPADEVKLAMLIQAIQRHARALPLALVRVGVPTMFASNEEFQRHLGLDVPIVEIGAAEGERAVRMAAVMRSFDPVMALHRPAAVVVAGSSDASLACGLVASKRTCPIVHADFAWFGDGNETSELNADLLARMSARLRAPVAQTWPAGGLAADALHEARAQGGSPDAMIRELVKSAWASIESEGHALVDIDAEIQLADRRQLTTMLADLREASELVPLVWPIGSGASARLDAFGLRKLIGCERIVVLGALDFAEWVAVTVQARCVITDSDDSSLKAKLLGVPCLWFGAGRSAPDRCPVFSKAALEDCLRRNGAQGRSFGDSRPAAATMLADALTSWLSGSGVDGSAANSESDH